MNKRVYHMLRTKQAGRLEKNLKKGYWTDQKMEEELVAAYDLVNEEEWRRYMQIVKKMHYSKEEISVEEMQHCYYCYKKVWSLTFQKQISDMLRRKCKSRSRHE